MSNHHVVVDGQKERERRAYIQESPTETVKGIVSNKGLATLRHVSKIPEIFNNVILLKMRVRFA